MPVIGDFFVISALCENYFQFIILQAMSGVISFTIFSYEYRNLCKIIGDIDLVLFCCFIVAERRSAPRH